MLAEEAKANKVWLVGGSFPEQDGQKLYNTSLSFNPDGNIVGKHRKVLDRLDSSEISAHDHPSLALTLHMVRFTFSILTFPVK
jgi:hypothetical protein